VTTANQWLAFTAGAAVIHGRTLSPRLTIGAFGRAPKHMGGVLGDSAPRASVIILAFPLDEGGAHATAGGSMFSNPAPPSRLQSLHADGTGVPVNRQAGIKGEALVSSPAELGDGILDRCMQTFLRGGRKFDVTAPRCPTFIVNRELWGFQGGQDSAEVPTKELGSSIHFTAESGETTVRVFDLSIVVPMDVDRIPVDRGLLDRGPHSSHRVQVLVSRVGQVLRFEWPKGVDILTSHRDGALGDAALDANCIDAQNCRAVACQFAMERVSFFDRAWDLSMAEEPVLWAGAFSNSRGSAAGAVEGSTIDCHCLA